MKEPLSSNPRVAELRQHAAFRKSFPQEHRMVLAAADEIERLTRELERFEVHFLKLRTEGFGLARDNTQDLIQVAKRLRAALEQIRDTKPYHRGTWHDVANRCHEIAREALRPAAEGKT